MKKFKIINIYMTLCIVLGTLIPNVSAFAITQTDRAGTSSITAVLFEDENGNKIQDSNEPGLSGVKVKLLDASEQEIDRTQTNNDGEYSFNNIMAGIYYIKIDTPEGYRIFSYGQATFGSDGLSEEIQLNEGETYTEAWIGYVSTDAAITGTVFKDINKNGIKESTEYGISEIEMGLYLKGTTEALQRVKTNVDGKYSFKKIPVNNVYEVKVISLPTQFQVIANNNFDNTGKSIEFNLKPVQTKINVNLALFEGIDVSDIIVEPTELNQVVGDTGTLIVTLIPEDATDKTITYESKDSSIITVDENGKWEAKGVGTTEITVKSGNISKTVKVTVKTKDVLV